MTAGDRLRARSPWPAGLTPGDGSGRRRGHGWVRTPAVADRAVVIIVGASVGVDWHAGARSGSVGLLLGPGLSTSAGGQKSGDAGYLRAQILIL